MDELIREAIERHKVGAFCGTDTACACDRTWRTNAAYRDHVAEQVSQVVHLAAQV